jgi:hypothetical protein
VQHTLGDRQLDVLLGVDVGELDPDGQRALVHELLNPEPTGFPVEIEHPAEHVRDLEAEPVGALDALAANQCHRHLLSTGRAGYPPFRYPVRHAGAPDPRVQCHARQVMRTFIGRKATRGDAAGPWSLGTTPVRGIVKA